MRKILSETEVNIVKGVFMGDSYCEVAARNGLSKATVFRVIEDVRRVLPDFDEIRDLVVRFRRCGLTLAGVERALVLKKLDSLNLSFDDSEAEVDILENFEVTRLFALKLLILF